MSIQHQRDSQDRSTPRHDGEEHNPLLSDPAEEPPHFTLRAVLVGLVIGSLIAFSNMYFGLQTGWISMMSLQASLLGYAVFKPFEGRLNVPFGPIENVVLQTTAVATGTMPLAAGFVGIIPALTLLNDDDRKDGSLHLSARQLILWSAGVAFFGVFFAVPLRYQTIIREKLRFPSGTATAQMISILHQEDDSMGPSHHHSALSAHSPEASSSHRPIASEATPLISELAVLENERNIQAEDWKLKLHALIWAFSLSSVYTIGTYFIPILSELPVFNWLTLGFWDATAWEWYLTPSPSYVGQGVIMGLPTTLSMLQGAIVGWGILSPLAKTMGWAPGPVKDWKTGGKGWILWVSLGIMIAESFVGLGIVIIKVLAERIKGNRKNITTRSSNSNVAEPHTRPIYDEPGISDADREEYIRSAQLMQNANISLGAEQEIEEEREGRGEYKDAPPDQLVPTWLIVSGLLLSSVFCIFTVQYIFKSEAGPIYSTIIAVLLAMLLSVLGVRALGETDINPVSGLGKVTQLVFAVVVPGGIVANLVAGGVAEAGAQQAGDLLQDLKTGFLLKASPKAQFWGQMIGSFVSVFVSTAAYVLYTTIYEIPGKEFQVPTAQVWLDMARLVNGHPLPPYAGIFTFAFAALFTFFVFLKSVPGAISTQHAKYIPQGIAFGIGMFNVPSFTLARVAGGLLGAWWDRFCDQAATDTREPGSTSGWMGVLRRYRRAGKVVIVVVASGFVLGEGTFAIVNMAMKALGVPHF